MVHNVKNLIFGLVVVIFATGVFISCDKSDNLVAPVATISNEQVDDLSSGSPEMRASRATISQTKFLPLYHWWEWEGHSCKPLICGETAYMVAVKAVATWNSIPYTMNLHQQNLIVNGTANNPNPYQLYNYWKAKDKNLATCDFARGANTHPNGENWTTRTKIKEFIETALQEKKLVIMPVRINGRKASYWNNDHTTSSTSASNETNNYISKYGDIGHWVVIYRLDVEKDKDGFSIGTAYYCDVLERTASSSMKTVNYLRLLDANRAAGSAYSAMWFDSPKQMPGTCL